MTDAQMSIKAKNRDRKYYVYLANLRNDFYNKGNTEMAIDVQEEIDTMGDEKNNFRNTFNKP
tara:strand:- start:339 stop:524 length:186 start_codon:yes stop_codon:yes gene_type:complete